MEKTIKGILMSVSFIVLFSIVGLGAFGEIGVPSPSETVICQGCSGDLIQGTYGKFSGFAQKDSTITLICPAGHQSCDWDGGGQTVAGKDKNFPIKIISDTVITLVLDGNGNNVKTVEIKLTSSGKSYCVPDLSEISIDGNKVKSDTTMIALTVGQRIPISVGIDYSQCPEDSGAVFSWISDGKSLFIENPNNPKTWLVVKNNPVDGKNLELKAQEVNGYASNEKTVSLNIIGNTPPTIAGLYFYTTPLSHKEFTVDCNKCLTGANTNEYGDYIARLDIVVRNNKDGSIVATGYDSVTKEDSRKPEVSMTLGDECNCSIEVTATDSFGASTKVKELLAVGFGNTDEDAPFIKLKEPIPCEGLNCTFDTQLTNDHDLGLSIYFYYRTVSGFEILWNKEGKPCRAPVCNGVFPQQGIYDVKIIMQYMREGKPDGKMSEKIVTVSVGGVASAVSPVSAKTATAVVQPTPVITRKPEQYLPVTTPTPEPYDRPKAPDIGIFSAIIIIMVVVLLKNNKRKR